MRHFVERAGRGDCRCAIDRPDRQTAGTCERLERERRRELLKRARTIWKDATMICVTHDVNETLAFGRVLVVSDGRVVEDGAPAAVASQPGSKYRAMLDADRAVREQLWGKASWRTLIMNRGRLTEVGDPS